MPPPKNVPESGLDIAVYLDIAVIVNHDDLLLSWFTYHRRIGKREGVVNKIGNLFNTFISVI